MKSIDKEKNLIRPANLLEGQPGKGYGIYEIKNKKIAVINLIGNVFMKKSQDLFSFAEKILIHRDKIYSFCLVTLSMCHFSLTFLQCFQV